jgi:hypothetical protein
MNHGADSDDLTSAGSVPSDTEALLAQIEQACRQLKMAQTTFGRLAVNDGKLVTRLQQGARVTLSTVNRVHRFIEAQGVAQATSLRSAIRGLNVARAAPDFRFYDNRQKYLMFVNTTSEKQQIADRALKVMEQAQPSPPAMRVMDAGAGDGTALARMMRGMHRRHPCVPFYVVAKEISMENVRLILEKMADRLQEHPSTVLVLTNLKYPEALRLKPRTPVTASRMIWNELPLAGTSAGDFEEQIAALEPWLAEYWQARVSVESGNAVSRSPVVLVLYRRDHRFALESILPRRGFTRADFDFILVSQPYRARALLEFKVSKVIAPLVRGLRANGRLLAVQGCGGDAGMELIHEMWPDEQPFRHGRADILTAVRRELGTGEADYDFAGNDAEEATFRFHVRTLPGEIGSDAPMSSSTILSAWNAATYVAQIEDDRLAQAMVSDHYRQATRNVLLRHGGLWFNDESFVVARRPTLD